MRDTSQRIIVGYISGIFGVQGWLKLVSYTRPRENIFSYHPWLVSTEQDWRKLDVLDNKLQGRGLIVRLEDVTNRDEASELLNAEIAIYRSQLPDSATDEYYWHDLLGLEVINQKGESLGLVTELLETGANDVLVVGGKQRQLIPFVKGVYVLDVAFDKGTIEVDWQAEIVK
jgi:16S rRNA processing protein RimM